MPTRCNGVTDPDGLRRRRLFGLDFVDEPDFDRVIERLERAPDRTALIEPTVVVTPNVDQLVHLDRGTDPEAAQLTYGAQVVLPDGQPIVWASRLLRAPLRSRLTGASLVDHLWPRLVDAGRRCVVVAASEWVADDIRASGPNCHALVAPMLHLDDQGGVDVFVDECAELVEAVDAEFVFVCLSYPKPNRIISGLLDRRDAAVPTYLAVGAAFDMHFGHVRRAPQWIQRVGMEWAFRFVQEPRRLFRRYFVDDVAFIGVVWREARRRRGAARSA